MVMGPQSAVVDGQRYAFSTRYAWNPQGWGPQTTGVPNASPTIPPTVAALSSSAVGGLVENVGGYGTAGPGNTAQAQAASDNPWSLKLSPTLWAVVLLVLSVLYLQKIHWSPS